LPRKFEELLGNVKKLDKKVDRIEQDVAILKQDVSTLKQDVAYLKGEFGKFKGREFERTIREKYYAYFGRLLRKSKLINFEEILPLLESAEDKN